jgi:truncated hemoglobin YjbI
MNRTIVIAALALLIGCAETQNKKDPDFSTSGNKEADQRAEQRMAKAEQMNPDEKSSQKPSKEKTAEDVKKLTLYERLGGEKGLNAIVNDFVPRAIADPRVNWERKGVTQGGVSIHRNKSVTWDANAGNVDKLKKHMVEFLSVATGGPAQYGGKEMKDAHAGLHITNAEFDASVGDLKATLDKLQVPNPEQKELLAIIESARPQVTSER